jgi:hypothetical protein
MGLPMSYIPVCIDAAPGGVADGEPAGGGLVGVPPAGRVWGGTDGVAPPKNAQADKKARAKTSKTGIAYWGILLRRNMGDLL